MRKVEGSHAVIKLINEIYIHKYKFYGLINKQLYYQFPFFFIILCIIRITNLLKVGNYNPNYACLTILSIQGYFFTHIMS